MKIKLTTLSHCCCLCHVLATKKLLPLPSVRTEWFCRELIQIVFCIFFYSTKVRQCPGQRLHPLRSCVVWRVGGSPDGLPLPERECECAAVLPTRACRSMPGTAGVSRMARRPIWPITQAGPRRFQRDPAATWSAAVSIGVSGRLGKRGQSPAGPSRDRHISSKGCNPSTHSLTHTQPSSSSMFSTQCSYGLLMGQRPWPWKLHKQTGRELNTTCSRLISLLFMTLFLLFDVRI